MKDQTNTKAGVLFNYTSKTVTVLFVISLGLWYGSALLTLRTATPADVKEAAAASECAMSKIAAGKPTGLIRDALYTASDAWSVKDLGVIADTCFEQDMARQQIAGLKTQPEAK